MSVNGTSSSSNVDIVEVVPKRTSESEIELLGKPSTGILAKIKGIFKSMVSHIGRNRDVTAGSNANATSIVGGVRKAEATKTTNAAASTKKFGNFDYGKFQKMSDDKKMAFITKISEKFSRGEAGLLRNIEDAISQHPDDAYLYLARFAAGGDFDYSKFKDLSNDGQRLVADTISKMPKDKKEEQLRAIEAEINGNSGDRVKLQVLKLVITNDRSVLIDFYNKCYDNFNKSIEGIRDKALNGQLDEAEKECFKEGGGILCKDCIAFMNAYVDLGGKDMLISRAFMLCVMLKDDMEKSERVGESKFFGEVLNTLETIKERLELEKYAEQFRPDTPIDERLKNLLGNAKGISAVQESSVLYELKALKCISENKGATAVDVLRDVFPLGGFKEEDAEKFLSRIEKNIKLPDRSTALSFALTNIHEMKSKGIMSDEEIVECIKGFIEDEEPTILEDVWQKRKIKDQTGIDFTSKQTRELLEKVGILGLAKDYRSIVKQINDLKTKFSADDEMIKTSMEIFARSSIATLEEAYETAKTYQKNEQESEELTEKLNALRPQGNKPSGRPTRGRRTRLQNVSHEQEVPKPQEPKVDPQVKYRELREQAYDGWKN